MVSIVGFLDLLCFSLPVEKTGRAVKEKYHPSPLMHKSSWKRSPNYSDGAPGPVEKIREARRTSVRLLFVCSGGLQLSVAQAAASCHDTKPSPCEHRLKSGNSTWPERGFADVPPETSAGSEFVRSVHFRDLGKRRRRGNRGQQRGSLTAGRLKFPLLVFGWERFVDEAEGWRGNSTFV